MRGESGGAGLGEYGTAGTQIENPSKRYPGHYFKVGYFRSSYNDGGIDRVFEKLLGKDGLHWVFEGPEEYEFQPNWRRVKERCAALIEEVRERVRRDGGAGLQVSRVGFNLFLDPKSLPDSENAALEIYRRHLAEGHLDARGSWSNRDGEFFGKDTPGKYLAFIPGTERSWAGKVVPVIYAVHDTAAFAEEPEKEPFEWYIRALEIVAETCDFVLGRPDPENYYLHWSS